MPVDYASWVQAEYVPLKVAIRLLLGEDPEKDNSEKRYLIFNVISIINKAKENFYSPVYGEDGHCIMDGDKKWMRGELISASNWKDVKQVDQGGETFVELGSFLEWTARREEFMNMAKKMNNGITYPNLLVYFLKEKGHVFSDVFLKSQKTLELRKEINESGKIREQLNPENTKHKESANERLERLILWAKEDVTHQGWKGWSERVGKREGITRQRIDKLFKGSPSGKEFLKNRDL